MWVCWVSMHVSRIEAVMSQNWWVMSHVWLGHTHGWIVSHIWMGYVAHIVESCPTLWMSIAPWMGRPTRKEELCHRYTQVTLNIHCQTLESWHTYEWFHIICDMTCLCKSWFGKYLPGFEIFFFILLKMWRFSWNLVQMWRFRHIVTSICKSVAWPVFDLENIKKDV